MAMLNTQDDGSERDSRMRITIPFLPQSLAGGLGDAIKRVTDTLHIPQCGGCAKRQEYLNERVVLRSLWED